MVDDSRRQRIVRSYHGQSDAVLLREAHQGWQVTRFDRDILADLFGPGISWRTKNAVHAGRLLQFPGERVFAAAAADDEDFHGNAASLGNGANASCSDAEITIASRTDDPRVSPFACLRRRPPRPNDHERPRAVRSCPATAQRNAADARRSLHISKRSLLSRKTRLRECLRAAAAPAFFGPRDYADAR